MSLLFAFHFFSFGLISFAEDSTEPSETQSYEERLLDYLNNTESVALSIPGAPAYTAPTIAAGFVVLYMTLLAGSLLADLALPSEFDFSRTASFSGVFVYQVDSSSPVQYSPAVYSGFHFTASDDFYSDFASWVPYWYSPYSPAYYIRSSPRYAQNGADWEYEYQLTESGQLILQTIKSDNNLTLSSSIFNPFNLYNVISDFSAFPISVCPSDPSPGAYHGVFYLSRGRSKMPDLQGSLNDGYSSIMNWVSDNFPDSVDDPEFLKLVEQVNPSEPDPTEPTDPPIIVNPPQIPAVTFPDYTFETYDVPEQAAQGIGFWFTLFADMLTESGLIWLVVLVGCIFLIYYILRW